jgi:hypothetical protein
MKRLLIITALLPLAAWAQTTTTSTPSTTTSTASTPASQERLVQKYTDLAGSEKNSKSLVDGLRESKKITLTDGKTTSTIDPPTNKMGYGNVNLALSIAEKSLADAGITNPTTEQLKTALMGGEIKTRTGTVKLEGVLQMRADGMGWGQIANKLGFKVGDVAGKAPSKTETTPGNSAKAERVSHARAEKPDRPNRVDRPERPSRPDKPERPGK